MIYSGADLIRSSGQQAERALRLKVADPVTAVESPEPSESPLDEGTQDALMRFAKFLHQKDKKPATPKRKAVPFLPEAYLSQIEMQARDQDRGSMLDISI